MLQALESLLSPGKMYQFGYFTQAKLVFYVYLKIVVVPSNIIVSDVSYQNRLFTGILWLLT